MTDPFFPKMNRGYNATFQPGRLSIGLFLPIEEYGPEDIPTLARHIERVQLAESLGFAAVWLRDVPFNVPAFGDVGQMFDPFVYLGALAASTRRIGLGVGSVILPLRHPAHVAKAAASADVLSGGRVMLGIASGDRPEEYPALNMEYDNRGARFRDSVQYIRACFQSYPRLDAAQGVLNGHIDMVPKPVAGQVPLLITGGSQQTPDWGAEHGDGWITYPRNAQNQKDMIAQYRRYVATVGQGDKPVMQSLYVDVLDRSDARTRPIVLGYQAGTSFLVDHLADLQAMGVNHVALNLRYNFSDVEETLGRLAQEVLPHFPTGQA
ncbi:LLM class oxidoreductase [uncultured Tateyamaria sp.]|uniref:LLM class oxidoreductase n=1 Tax=uncultured Tateyamaria sp. TaxID=455651 RepID=UPI00260C8EFD|nr:LLM class oxidoreductase [uncultured Tateyamaria sp.]